MSALINQARSRVPRLAEAAVERARLTVVPRRSPTTPRLPFVMLVSLLLIGGVAGLLAFNTSMQQVSFTVTALENQAAGLNAEEQSLQMRLAGLRDPQHLAEQARNMGLVPPASPAFIRLSDGKVLGTPAPALAADGIQVRPGPTAKPAGLRPESVIVWADPSREGERNDGRVEDGRTGDGDSGAARGDGAGQPGRNDQPVGDEPTGDTARGGDAR